MQVLICKITFWHYIFSYDFFNDTHKNVKYIILNIEFYIKYKILIKLNNIELVYNKEN